MILTIILILVALLLAGVWIRLHVENKWPTLGQVTDIDGTALHYVDVQAGRDADLGTIVFIHGASSNLRDLHTPMTRGLKGRARMIFVDRPGHGYSGRKSSQFTNPVLQAKVIAELLDKLDTGRVTVVGHSWGSSVALALTVFHPKNVSGLMVMAPVSHPWEGGVEWYYDLANTPIVGEMFAWVLAPVAGWFRYEEGIKSVFAPNIPPEDYEQTSGTRLVLRPSNFLANARDVANLNTNLKTYYQRYREISVPTAIIAGGEDIIVTNSLHAEGLAREIKGARLTTIEGLGHKPDYLALDQAVTYLEWIAKNSRQ